MRLTELFFVLSSDLPKGLLENNPVFINEGGTISELSL